MGVKRNGAEATGPIRGSTVDILKDVVPARATMPVLAHVWVGPGDGLAPGATLVATDLEVAVEVRAGPDEVAVNVIGLAPLRALERFAAMGGPVEVRFERVEAPPDDGTSDTPVVTRHAALAAGGVTGRVTALYPADFPTIPAIVPRWRAEASARDLHAALTAVAAAMSSDRGRPGMNGVYVEVAGDGKPSSLVVAMDGHRMHVADVGWRWDRAETPDLNDLPTAARPDGFILPARLVEILVKRLDPKSTDTVTVEAGFGVGVVEEWRKANEKDRRAALLAPTFTRVTVGRVVYTARLVDGTFPEWRTAAPVKANAYTASLTVRSVALREAGAKIVKVAGLSRRPRDRYDRDPITAVVAVAGLADCGPLRIEHGGAETFTVRVGGTVVGRMSAPGPQPEEDAPPPDPPDAKDVDRIGLDVFYVLDALAAVDPSGVDAVTLHLSAPLSAVVVTLVGATVGAGLRAVIMPARA